MEPSHPLIVLTYIVASVLFIVGLKMLNSATTARRGNVVSAVGMLLAVLATRPWFDRVAAATVRWAWLSLVPVALLAWAPWEAVRPVRYSLGFTVNALIIAVLVVQVLLMHRHPLWRWLGHPAVAFCGVI